MEGVRNLNIRRLDASQEDSFVGDMVYEIRRTKAPAFRLHVIGDFYNVEYVEKWIEIATRLPSVMFFGSTRSWHCGRIGMALKRFRDLPNVFFKASVDVTDTLDPFGCGWNIWSVEGEGILCPHDSNVVANCAECKRCWTIKDLNVKELMAMWLAK